MRLGDGPRDGNWTIPKNVKVCQNGHRGSLQTTSKRGKFWRTLLQSSGQRSRKFECRAFVTADPRYCSGPNPPHTKPGFTIRFPFSNWKGWGPRSTTFTFI